MKAELRYKLQGVRGTGYQWKTAGEIVIFPNGGCSVYGNVPFISVDAFEGRGEDYRRREGSCLIQVNDGSEGIFSGSFDELKAIIKMSEIKMSTIEDKNPSIYEMAVLLKCEMSNHESDLYLKVTPVTEALVENYRFKKNVRQFTSRNDLKPWFDIPFAYDPWWINKLNKDAKEIE